MFRRASRSARRVPSPLRVLDLPLIVLWRRPRSWIEASTRKHAESDLYGEDFGYLWRMIDREVGGRNIRSFEAWGNGGQYIMVFPSLELVAVFTGENYGQFPEMERPFDMMDRFILPAVQ